MHQAGLYCHWLVVCVRVQKLGVPGALRASEGLGGTNHASFVHFYCSDCERRCVIRVSFIWLKMSNDWSNGLCSCFEDCSTCKHIILFLCARLLEAVFSHCLHPIFWPGCLSFCRHHQLLLSVLHLRQECRTARWKLCYVCSLPVRATVELVVPNSSSWQDPWAKGHRRNLHQGFIDGVVLPTLFSCPGSQGRSSWLHTVQFSHHLSLPLSLSLF